MLISVHGGDIPIGRPVMFLAGGNKKEGARSEKQGAS
jgi:hypothetical protein